VAEYEYRSRGDLHDLGVRIRDLAVRVTMSQSASYGDAQQRANNDATRVDNSQPTRVEGYQPPGSGRPDDDANLRNYVQQEYAGIPDMFTAFAVPDPDYCRAMVDAFYQSAVTLAPGAEIAQDGGKVSLPLLATPLDGVNTVADGVIFITTRMKSWVGEAAGAFERYIKKREEVAKWQRDLAIAVAVLLEAQLEIRRRMLTDVWEIGQKTIKVLESLDGWCPPNKALQTTLTVAGAVGAVLLAGGTGGAAAVAVEGVQSAAAILGAAGAPPKADIGGLTVPAVISSMAAAMTRLQRAVDIQERDLVECVQKAAAWFYEQLELSTNPVPPKFDRLANAGVDELDGLKQFYDR
jgi:hypothetical protein